MLLLICYKFQFFDEIKVEDPRVAEFCAKTTEPSPHAILLTCLQRNFGLGDMDIKYQGNTLKHQKNEFTMTVGKHTTTVVCKNKRDGKQRASQAILQVRCTLNILCHKAFANATKVEYVEQRIIWVYFFVGITPAHNIVGFTFTAVW